MRCHDNILAVADIMNGIPLPLSITLPSCLRVYREQLSLNGCSAAANSVGSIAEAVDARRQRAAKGIAGALRGIAEHFATGTEKFLSCT